MWMIADGIIFLILLGTGTSSRAVPYVVTAMLLFLAYLICIEEFSDELAVRDNSASCYKNWFNIANAIAMVIAAA